MEGLEQKVVAPPVGQAGTPPEPGQSQGATQPEELTREEVLKLVGEAEEKAFRRAQGLITKTNTRIRSEVTKLEQQLAKAGVTLDVNQKAALEQQVTEQVVTEETSAADGKGQPPAHLVEPQTVDPITQVAQQMMKEAGVVILDSDPEAKLIDMSDPYAFLKSLPAAIEVKKAREAKTSNPTSTPGLSGAGGPVSPYSGRSGLDLISEHFRKKGV